MAEYPLVSFDWLANLPKAYQEGKNNQYINEQREAFKEGVPKDASGNIDYGKALEILLQKGGTPQVQEAAKLDLQRQGLKAIQDQNTALFGTGAQSLPNLPPSTSRVGGTAVPQQQPMPQPQGRYAGGDSGQGTIISIVTGNMPPDHPQAGVIAGNIAKSINTDPNQPLNPEQQARVEGLVKAYTARSTAPGGAVPVPMAGTAQAAPMPPQVPPQAMAPQPGPPMPPAPQPVPSAVVAQRFPSNPAAPVSPAAAPGFDPTLGGLVPPQFAGDHQKYISNLQAAAANAGAAGMKEAAKAYLDRADAVQKALGQYRESGLKERAGIIEPAYKQVIERLGTSQQKADSIADGITVSHDLMAQLDSKAGIFSGQWADSKLALAKIGKAIGLDLAPDQITNTESFSALVGKKVAQTVKSFGSGTSITNQDREYAAKMEAGDIKLDESSMRRILTITDKINRGVIDKHNKQVDDLVKSRPELAHLETSLKVDQPPPYSPPPKQAARSAAPPPGGATIINPKTKQIMTLSPDGKSWVPSL